MIFGSYAVGGNLGKSHIFIDQVKCIVASVHTAWKNIASTFWKQDEKVLLVQESTGCASVLF